MGKNRYAYNIFLFVVGVSIIGGTAWYCLKSSDEIKQLKITNQEQVKDLEVLKSAFMKKTNEAKFLKIELKEKKKYIGDLNIRISDYEGILRKLSMDIKNVQVELGKERLKKIPDNYYNVRYDKYENSVKGLSEFLSFGFKLPTSYKLNIFDCSESSAYLEWALEKQGFDASICVGKSPWDSGVNHAWVFVKTKDGYKTAVEATSLTGGAEKWGNIFDNLFESRARGIIYYNENDPVTVNYYNKYDQTFESIDEAVNSTNLEEWNWWEGAWGLN